MTLAATTKKQTKKSNRNDNDTNITVVKLKT